MPLPGWTSAKIFESLDCFGSNLDETIETIKQSHTHPFLDEEVLRLRSVCLPSYYPIKLEQRSTCEKKLRIEL